MSGQEKRKPDIAWRAGPCSLAVWWETKKSSGGREYLSYTLGLTKSTEQDTGQYKDSTVWFYGSDLHHLQSLLDTFRLNFMVKAQDLGGQHGE